MQDAARSLPREAAGSRDLVVIESPGKLRSFRAALSSLGIMADVTATLGHLFENPRSLRPVAIVRSADGQYLEPQRAVAKPGVHARLVECVRGCSRVVVATDDDAEGHVIAQDVARVATEVRPGIRVLRLRAAALDAASLRDAWSWLAPLDPGAATPGTARRLADRLVGAAYTDFGEGVVVGRVQSAVLGLCAGGLARRVVATAPVPAADGGRPFQLTVELPASVSASSFAAMAAQLPPVTAIGVEHVPRVAPMNGGDALLALESELGLTIDAAADLLQDLYEAGKISYPRTASRTLTGAGAEAVGALAMVRGILAFNRDAVPRHHAAEGPHEAIRTLAKDVNLVKPLSMRGSLQEAGEALIARRGIEAGVVGVREHGDPRELPLWARSGALVREAYPRLPWAGVDRATQLRSRTRSPEAALVAAMVAAGVGRPSTWAGHASRMVRRGLVDEQMRLTPAGVDALAAAPAALRDPAGSQTFESCVEGEGSCGERVEAALVAVGAERALALAASSDVADVPVAMPESAEPAVPAPAAKMIEEEADEYVYRLAR